MKKDFYDYSQISSNLPLLKTVKQCNPLTLSSERIDVINATFSTHDLLLAEKFLHKLYARQSRLKKRLSHMFALYDDCVFVTLTLDDSHLSKSRDLLFLYAKRQIKSFCVSYIGNEDLGSENHRYHFHFVCGGLQGPLIWPYGFSKVIPIRHLRQCDVLALSRYVDKFVNHTVKDTVLRSCYSKNPIVTDVPSFDIDGYLQYCIWLDVCRNPVLPLAESLAELDERERLLALYRNIEFRDVDDIIKSF